jgi:hypothetical protein
MVQSGSWIGFDFRRKPAQLYSRGEQKDNKKKKKWLYAGIVMLSMNGWMLFHAQTDFKKWLYAGIVMLNMNCWILFLCTN